MHRRKEVKDFLARGAAHRIHIEALPFYAPDLNPVEWLWRHLKEVELSNLASLVPAFFAGAGLSLTQNLWLILQRSVIFLFYPILKPKSKRQHSGCEFDFGGSEAAQFSSKEILSC